MRIEASS